MKIRGYQQKCRIARAIVIATLALVLLPACTNNLLQKASRIANTLNTGNPLEGLGNGGNSAGIRLSSVQLDTYSPTTTLDLIGDGSGSIGSSCQAQPEGGGAAAGASTCTCAFNYILGDGTKIGPVWVDTTYFETNMLRCPYTSIPAGVSYVDVNIHLTGPDLNSNTVTFRLGGMVPGGLDVSNPLSYTQVQRYQCRDIISIGYLWDGGAMYDPFLSEDPRYSYPLNFYTTNMGDTLAAYASGRYSGNAADVASWNCPALPNDPTFGMDLSLYSLTADQAGKKAIYPPEGVFDRSTFYVANAPVSVFTIPVNSFLYPGALTNKPVEGQNGAAGQAAPSIGYAASPIPIAGGGETCPDASVPIPPNFHWAKLWLFRKQLPQRVYPISRMLAAFGSGDLACNAPPFRDPALAPPRNSPFTDCSGAPDWNNRNANGLAARFSKSDGQCFNITPGGTTNATTLRNFDGVTYSHPGYPGIDFTPFANGTDIWEPVAQDPTYGCGASQATDNSHACQAQTGHVPWDNEMGQGAIDQVSAGPRFDYVFVVSPPSVNRQDMASTSSSSIHGRYTPMRFMSPNDCRSKDPDHPDPNYPGDCSPSRMLTYGITVSDPNDGGQSGGLDPNEPGEFPMCVLQPN